MTCYFPLRWYEGPVKEPGKINVVYSRRESERGVELNLPCGKCSGCLMARSKAWAVRCMHEASLYEDNCFITLTFDDKNLPYNRSLDVSLFQDFMKRLRKRFGSGIRYFHCGEYGEKYGRPHYHALLFNHDFDDRVLFKETDSGSRIYISGELQKLWPLGHSSVGDVTFKSASYVARYCMKKVNVSDEPSGLTKEYVTMSRRPGIGKGWFEKFKGDVFPSDEVVLSGGMKMKPPRYYDNLLDKSEFDVVKSARKEAMRQLDPREFDSFRMPVKEEVFRASIRELKRSLEEDVYGR